MENGTARLATTQSVTRGRWLLAKLGFALLLVTLTTAALGGLFAWWRGAVDPFVPHDWLHDPTFDTTLPVFVSFGLFSVVLGITIGALIRRTVPAMVLTFLIGYAATIALDIVKDRLATPRRITFPLEGARPPRSTTPCWSTTGSARPRGTPRVGHLRPGSGPGGLPRQAGHRQLGVGLLRQGPDGGHAVGRVRPPPRTGRTPRRPPALAHPARTVLIRDLV